MSRDGLERADLVRGLAVCSDPLAPDALSSLVALPEVYLAVSRVSTAELGAVYEDRLARADRGAGPSTGGLREYAARLRDPSLATVLDEVGWRAPDRFWVALVDQGKVIAVTWVARAVRYLGSSLMGLAKGTFAWVDVKTFEIADGFDDRTLVKNLLDEPAYADTYQGSPFETQTGEAHGPFLLDRIRPGEFTLVSSSAASAELEEWQDQFGSKEPQTRAGVTTRLHELLDDADAVYRLPSLDESCQHESGWVVGSHGFHELVALHRAAHRLHVIVASDD